MRKIPKKVLVFVPVLVVLILLLPTCISSYYVGLIIQIFIMAMFAMSLNILVGYTGLPSLGHSAYFGVAAYTAGFLSLAGVKNFWLVAVAGAGIGCLTASIFGLLALRAIGPYFMIITLALAQVLWGIAFKWRSLTNGDDGLPGIQRPSIGLGIDLSVYHNFYYFTFLILLIASIALWIIVNSPFGYTLRGIRESETRMKSLGYNVWLYKYLAFVFAGLFAGLSGVMWVYYIGYVNPSDLGIDFSVKALLMIILGGAGNLFGPAIGAGIIVLLENIISGITERWSLVMGVVYVAAIMLFSEGITSIFKKGK